MELMKSSLNRAHQCGRKANRMMAQEKYEEAIACRGEAADLLKEALQMTQNEQARLSLELQRDRHLQQQCLIQNIWERAKLARKPTVSSSSKKASLPPLSISISGHIAEQVFIHSGPATTQVPLQGCKTAKDDRTRLEEQITTIGDLRNLLVVLLMENEKLMEENKTLRMENVQLKKDSHHQSSDQPVEIPQAGPDP